ncbi:Cyclophilin-type peptidyl-prolyl cis-trans isomerase [Parasponia andersonii]|uniref:Cyclophilin-type peptidyl-prolyl cis-trans isomerase n=1 Tax=Parasponia andersonii TaxID=3476 RepID=A0A2P5CLZ6_PARAD|nr:Cyclophilin-type peptidyl-prolyl cis-trans isomerase [Parasponia andersonii]
MLQNPKFLQSSTQFLPPPTPSPLNNTHVQEIPTSQSYPTLQKCCKFSRREVTIRSNSVLLFLLGFQGLEPFKLSKAKAEENDNVSNPASTCGSAKSSSKKAFLDISIDGEPVGRIVIGLYGKDAPLGATRFGNLVSGSAGISYRRKEFIKIMPGYVQHGGVRSYGVDAELANRTGSDLEAENLVDEWERAKERCLGTKNLAGTVSLIVRDPSRPPPKQKLVARGGKLEIDEEEVKPAPNGTEFIISTKDSPELDDSALVVGKVLEGLEVVERIGKVKTVQENTSSPYFRVAKLIGDKRAVVAERGFNRPYSKVVVKNCGLLE